MEAYGTVIRIFPATTVNGFTFAIAAKMMVSAFFMEALGVSAFRTVLIPQQLADFDFL